MTPATLAVVKRLLALLPGSGAGEIEVTEGGVRVRIVARGAAAAPAVAAEAAPQPAPAAEAVPAAAPETGEITVRASMHGVFHRAPAPGAEPFVQPGVTVSKRQPLCILEAMKVFNTVAAPQAGVVSAILAENGQDVTLGQPLFTLRPA